MKKRSSTKAIVPPGPKPAGILLSPSAVTVVVVVARAPGTGPLAFNHQFSSAEKSHVQILLDTAEGPQRAGRSSANDWDSSRKAELDDKHIAQLTAAYEAITSVGGVEAVALTFSRPADVTPKAVVTVYARVGYGVSAHSEEQSRLLVEELDFAIPQQSRGKGRSGGKKEDESGA